MTDAQLAFLKHVSDSSGQVELKRFCDMKPGAAAKIQDIAARGYIRLVPARCGPLAIATGSMFAVLTRAGAEHLRAIGVYDKKQVP